MKVRSVYHPGSLHTTPADPMREAARQMEDHRLSCLPVLEGEAVVGVVTEHDVIDEYVHAGPASGLCVADYLTDDGVTVSLDDDCGAALLKMLELGCHDLPVVEEDRLVGMISERDLILRDAHRGPAEWPPEPPPDVDSEA